MTKPVILHIYKDYYPPVIGGVERNIHDVCEGLSDYFNFYVLIANNCFKTEEERIGKVNIIKARSLGRIASAPLCPDFPKLMKKYKADILHFHCPNPTGDISYLLSRPKGKVVVTYHSDIVRQKWAMFAYGGFLRKFLRIANVIMPTSPNYVESSKYLKPIKEKCVVIPLGIDTARFKKTPEIEKNAQLFRSRFKKPIVLFVGRLRYYKGLHFLINAMQKIDAICLIIGNGPMERELISYVKKLSLEDKVFFKGSVTDEELVIYYHSADIFCLPSFLRSEAFGLCQIESMASGVPVVSTNLDTGVPFVNQHLKSGIVVPPANSDSLENAISTLLNNPSLRREMGEYAEFRAQKEFDISIMLEKIKSVYDNLL